MIPILEFLQQAWENMANEPKFYGLINAIHGGLENICKWYIVWDSAHPYATIQINIYPFGKGSTEFHLGDQACDLSGCMNNCPLTYVAPSLYQDASGSDSNRGGGGFRA